METFIIGSGTGVPTLRRGPSGIVLKSEASTILFDGGPGTLRRMLEIGVSYRDIDALFLSHTHPDHVLELVPFLFATKITPGFTRVKELTILGPPGLGEHYNKLPGLYGEWMKSPQYAVTLEELRETNMYYKDLKVTTKFMNHSLICIGYRIQDANGSTFVYSGDTDYCENIIKLGTGADVLVLECSFPDDKKVVGHLTPSLAGRIAREANCKKLVLTHFYPTCDEIDVVEVCKKIYHGEIVKAEDLMRIEI